MTRLKLNTAPTRSRVQSLASGNAAAQPTREGGKFGAGMLSNVSAITKGEALGHGFWIDEVFLSQVASAMSAATNGSKSRFTHPGLSADGLAKGLGIAMGGEVKGEQVITDLHFYASAHISPDGDLAGYVMQRAEEDPLHFGTSIVFIADEQAEKDFLLANGGVIVVHDDGWEVYETVEGFQSPDALNVDNLPHCRLKEFLAVDVVDDPAANPGGLFHRDLSTIDNAQSYLDYAIGLSDAKPTSMAFDVDPERARLFFQRYAAQRGLSLPSKGTPMAKLLKKGQLSSDPAAPSDPNTPPQEAANEPGAVTCPDCGAVFVPDAPAAEPAPMSETPQTPAEYAANHAKYVNAFGAENGSKWFFGKVAFHEAQKLHFAAQIESKDAEITSLKAELKTANEKLAAIANSGEKPLESSPPPKGTESQSKGMKFADLIKSAKN
jgi:hypothetical protein